MCSFFSSLHIPPVLKAATKVVENERARAVASEDEPSAAHPETEAAEVDLSKGERCVYSGFFSRV